MRSTRFISLIVALGLLAASLPLTVAAAPPAQTNLLKNPGFEEGFTGGVANSWARWSVFNPDATPQTDCGRKDPAFQQMTSATDAKRVKDGSNSQQILTPVQDPGFGFYAGLQQTVAVTPGKTYRFTVYAHAWSSTKDNSALSEGTGPAYFEVGIGQGATYAADPTIKRSGIKDIKDNWVQLSIDATATGNQITVFTYANPSACSKHNEAFFDAASLTEVGASTTVTPGTAAPTQPSAAQPTATLRIIPTKFPTPTANAQGQIIYTVQAGNTIIDICGVIGRGNDPACIDDILKWNSLTNPKGIYVGQQLIISQPGGAAPQPTPTTVGATAVAGVTETPAAIETSVTQPTEQPTQPAQATATPAGAAAICVTLYNDANGTGVLDAGEGLVAGGSFNLLDVGNSNTVATYTTDGASEPHCFENLPSGNYRITSTVPEGYKATTRSDWDLTLAAGSTANLEFGAQSTGQTGGGATGGGTDGGGSDNTSRLVRALLAAGGVVLLLIAAGVAGFLVLTRRR